MTDGIIAAGGIVGANVNSLCHHFSVHTRSWRRLPDMSTARMAAAAVLVGDVMQVFSVNTVQLNRTHIIHIRH